MVNSDTEIQAKETVLKRTNAYASGKWCARTMRDEILPDNNQHTKPVSLKPDWHRLNIVTDM